MVDFDDGADEDCVEGIRHIALRIHIQLQHRIQPILIDHAYLILTLKEHPRRQHLHTLTLHIGHFKAHEAFGNL